MQYLNQPLVLQGMRLNNRLVMPPMATAKSTAEGAVTQALCEYYRARAEGGFLGLIITEHSYVSAQGKASAGQLSAADDGAVEGLRELVAAARRDGARVMAQINHAGAAADPAVTGCEAVAPSAAARPQAKADLPLPCALTNGEIADIAAQFAQAARRVQQAGFDGVEIHAAHGYLLNQFYSPLTNFRDDEYGPDCIENRVRFHLQVIEAVRGAVGPGYPVALRFGGCDYHAGGSTVEDSVRACALFERAGVDLLDISGGMYGYRIPGLEGPGYFREMTAAIKKAVSAPVLLTGGVTAAAEAERLLAQGAADLIGVGRALLADPRWAEKAFA